MMRTSWVGMAARESIEGYGSAARHALQRPADLVDRDHPPQDALAVDREQRSDGAKGLGGEQLLERRVGPDRALAVVGHHELAHRPLGLRAAQVDNVLERRTMDEPDEAVGRVDHREPLPALVAAEVAVE